MPLVHLDTTPSEPAHRVNRTLMWQPIPGHAPDGQLETLNVDGVMTPVLCQQPYKPNRYLGVSLFVPQCDQRIFDAAHDLLGRGTLGCVVSVPHTPLPAQLQLVNDHAFQLRLFGMRENSFLGQHYCLFTTTEMPVSVFEQCYGQLMQTFQMCTVKVVGAASLTSLTDRYVMPADQHSVVAVSSLEALADQTSDPNSALFATLFALDIRACDTDFEDVLNGCGNRAALVAAALDQYVVRDPLLREAALDAQEAYEAELPESVWITLRGPRVI